MTARTFLGARYPWSRSGTLNTMFVPISAAGSLLSWKEKPFFELVVLTRFCTFSLNVDSILPYTGFASDFQSETLTVFTATSTNSMNKLVTHWTLVSAWWLLLTNCTVNFFVVFLIYCFFWSVIGLIFIFSFSNLLVGLFLVSTIIHSCIKELFQFFFSFRWRVQVFSEWRIPKSDPLGRSKHSLIRACLNTWMQSLAFLAWDKP